MSFGILNLLMLAGLAGLAIPIVIHLLNRRRFDVVDWGAMQFLHLNKPKRRRLLIEQLLLLLVRMGLLGLMVLALAGPYVTGLAMPGGRSNRDIVLIFDGSASMGLEDGKSPTPHEAAKEWAAGLLDGLAPGDRVTLFQAGKQGPPVVPEPTHDLERARGKIAHLPPPQGGCDWPQAVRQAHEILTAQSRSSRSDIILLSDGTRHGWADEASLFHWERFGARLGIAADQAGAEEGAAKPRIWVVNVRPQRGEPVPNYALQPLRVPRRVAGVGQKLTFKTAITVAGQPYEPPYRIRLQVDGQERGPLESPSPSPPGAEGRVREQGQVPLTFTHRFLTPGLHQVTVIVEPDPPAAQRGATTPLKDWLPADNRQDVTVEVVQSLPVLLVDGDPTLSAQSSTYFLRQALARAPDSPRPSAVLAHTVAVREFEPALLTGNLDPKLPDSRPRVLVLADVPRLTQAQQQAVDRFLEQGGGVLVVLGERVEGTAPFYNDELYRGSRGWLPARLSRAAGDRTRPDRAATVDVKQLHHPSLELFKDHAHCTLDQARFPRWWKITTAGQPAVAPAALLTTGDAFLVEKPYKKGKVLLCTVPLDGSWGSSLAKVWEFPVWAHELVYYLADVHAAPSNPPPGQDPRESDLTLSSEEDRAKVAAVVPLQYQNDLQVFLDALGDSSQSEELWWLVLMGVLGLLCVEVWLTRRMAEGARAGEPPASAGGN